MSRTEPAGTPLGDAFHVYDTTLRDGAQREGISYSVADKLAVARLLDERRASASSRAAGRVRCPRTPSSSPAPRPASWSCGTRALVAFGATRRPASRAADDPQVRALLDSRAPVVTPGREVRPPARRAGAAHRRRRRTCAMVARHRRVPARRGPAGVPRLRALLRRLRVRPRLRRCGCSTPRPAPAPTSSSCATPTAACCRWARPRSSAEVRRPHRLPARHPLPGRHRLRGGQHASPPSQAGATHVQCTANGYGERAGNADLFAVVGNLVTKLDLPVLPDGRAGGDDPGLARARRDRQHRPRHPPGLRRVVGVRPQGGAARERDQGRPGAVQPPGPDGRRQRACGSWSPRWPAGPASSSRAASSALDLAGHPDAVGRVVDTVKEREARGWSFEAADASLRAADARRASATGRRPGAAVHAGVLPGHRRAPRATGPWSPRRRSRCTSAASGSSPPPRATARSTPWTPRCGRRSTAPARGWTGRRAGRLQGAHPPARATRARHRRHDPGARRVHRPRRGSGRRSACTATSSRPPGWRWSTR